MENIIAGSYIECFIIKKQNSKLNYLGIAISSKIAKAVRRNQIKRLIRENYKEQEKDLKTGNKIIFLWKKKAKTTNANYKNIKKDMEKIFEKAELYKVEE